MTSQKRSSEQPKIQILVLLCIDFERNFHYNGFLQNDVFWNFVFVTLMKFEQIPSRICDFRLLLLSPGSLQANTPNRGF